MPENFPSSLWYLAHLSSEAGSIQIQAVHSALMLEKASQDIDIETHTIDRKNEKQSSAFFFWLVL